LAFLKKNEIATMPKHKVHTAVPNCIKNFLPFLFIIFTVIIEAITESANNPKDDQICAVECP
jgi:hypothetical protein